MNMSELENQYLEGKQEDQFMEMIKRIKLKGLCVKMRKNLPSRRFSKLQQNQFELINDQAYNTKIKNESQKQKNQADAQNKTAFSFFKDTMKTDLIQINSTRHLLSYKQNMQKIEKMIMSIPSISPSGRFIIFWKIYMIFIIILLMFTIPLCIAFNLLAWQILGKFEIIIIISLVSDLFINLNTAHTIKGKKIQNKLRNVEKYIKSSLFLDLLSIVPFITYNLLVEIQDKEKLNYAQFIQITFFTKIKIIDQTLRILQDRFHFSQYIHNLVRLMKLFLQILFISHIFACIWIYAGRYQFNQKQIKQNWIAEYDMNDKYTIYNIAVYYSIVTMITVGYGDILPTNNDERLLCVFTMLISCGVFAYSVNQIGNIFDAFSACQDLIDSKIRHLNNYMKIKNISKDLQHRIRIYLQYYLSGSLQRNIQEEQDIIGLLSENLQNELTIEANKIALMENGILSKNFSNEFVKQLPPIIKEAMYTPEQIIYHQDQIDECYLYFVEKGQVDIYCNKTQKIFKIKEGQSFGAYEFFLNSSKRFTAKSKQFTNLLKISRKDFLEYIISYEQDYEKFCIIKDNLQYGLQIQQIYQKVHKQTNNIHFDKTYYDLNCLIDEKCLSCNSQDHILEHCPLIHLIIDKHKYIFRQQKLEQERQYQDVFDRRDKSNSLVENFYVLEELNIFIEYESTLIEHYIQQNLNSNQQNQQNENQRYENNSKIEDNEAPYKNLNSILQNPDNKIQSSLKSIEMVQSQSSIFSHDSSAPPYSSIKKSVSPQIKPVASYQNEEKDNIKERKCQNDIQNKENLFQLAAQNLSERIEINSKQNYKHYHKQLSDKIRQRKNSLYVILQIIDHMKINFYNFFLFLLTLKFTQIIQNKPSFQKKLNLLNPDVYNKLKNFQTQNINGNSNYDKTQISFNQRMAYKELEILKKLHEQMNNLQNLNQSNLQPQQSEYENSEIQYENLKNFKTYFPFNNIFYIEKIYKCYSLKNPIHTKSLKNIPFLNKNININLHKDKNFNLKKFIFKQLQKLCKESVLISLDKIHLQQMSMDDQDEEEEEQKSNFYKPTLVSQIAKNNQSEKLKNVRESKNNNSFYRCRNQSKMNYEDETPVRSKDMSFIILSELFFLIYKNNIFFNQTKELHNIIQFSHPNNSNSIIFNRRSQQDIDSNNISYLQKHQDHLKSINFENEDNNMGNISDDSSSIVNQKNERIESLQQNDSSAVIFCSNFRD